MFTSKKETTVREKILKHLDQSRRCLEAAHETFLGYVAGDKKRAEAAFDLVESSERAGDQLRREIYRLLGEGAFLPILRADLHKLVALVDELAGLAEDFCDMLMGQRPKLPPTFCPPFEEIFKRTHNQFLDLQQVMDICFSGEKLSPDKITEKINALSRVEHEIDDIEWKFTVALFASRMPLANKLHLKNLLTQASLLSNKIEDIGDTLGELVVKLQV